MNPPNSRSSVASPFARRIRVLIVDDHELVRQGLRVLIERTPDLEFCGEAGDEAEAMRIFEQCRPDVAIVDLSLSSGDGLSLIKWIHKQHSECKTVVCTMHDEHLYGERALRAGANGYVNKQLACQAVIEAIDQAVFQRGVDTPHHAPRSEASRSNRTIAGRVVVTPRA